MKCNTYFDKDGNPLKSFGVAMDIKLIKENDLLLEKSVSTKDKLMSILAHDLRSPFHKIIGFTGLLIDNIKNPSFAESERYLNIIYTSSEKTLALLNKLLNWIRYQTTEITFKPDHLSVSDIISDILDLETLLAASKKINLHYGNTEDFEIYADENMLKIVIRNLISNAIKFTNFGGEIKINSILTKQGVEIIITDDGIGIDKQRIETIFTSALNSTPLGTLKEKGTGEGLQLCKELIDRHQGKIWVESEIAKGSKLKIFLPNKDRQLAIKTTYRLQSKKRLRTPLVAP